MLQNSFLEIVSMECEGFSFLLFSDTQVCSTLSLTFIGKILSKYQPDEFSPDPVSSELLEAINSEVNFLPHHTISSKNTIVSVSLFRQRSRRQFEKKHSIFIHRL